MKKILFVLENLGAGGAERVLPCLLKYMDKTKYDITVLTLFEGGINKKRLPINVHYINRKAIKFKGISWVVRWFSPKILYQYYVKTKLPNEQFDIIIAYMHGLPTKVVAGASCRKITWMHCIILDGYAPIFARLFNSKKNMIKCLKAFDRIVGVSKLSCESFKKFSGRTQGVELIHNTIDIDEIKNNSVKSNPYSDLSNVIKIITVGHLRRVKGNDRLLEAVYKLKELGFNFHLTILGEGNERGQLEEYIKTHGLENIVDMPGHIDNPYPYVSNANIYICPSRSEGFSTSVSEAIILGVAVVSTRVSGAEEILGEHNEYGIVCDNSTEGIFQGLKQMLQNDKLRLHYTEQARKRISMFQPESTAKKVENLIDELSDKD